MLTFTNSTYSQISLIHTKIGFICRGQKNNYSSNRKKKNIPKYLKLILIKVEENRILYHSRHLTPRIESNSLEKEEKKNEIRKKMHIRQLRQRENERPRVSTGIDSFVKRMPPQLKQKRQRDGYVPERIGAVKSFLC